MKTKSSKHLDIYDREAVMNCLNSNMSLKQISDCIFKDERTISKEIKKRRNKTENGRFDYLFGGKEKSFADKYIICKRCSRYPYVCNGCPNLKNCNYKYRFKYNAQEAQENYEIILKESRKGLDCSLEEKIHFDSVLKKGIEKGQSVFHIVKSNPDIRYSISSTYRLINSEQTVTQGIDLIRAVKLKPRKKYAQKNIKSDKQELRKGRTYKDFLTRVNNEFLPSITQTDTVESVKEGSHKVLFTIHFTGTHFMVAFILDSKKRINR